MTSVYSVDDDMAQFGEHPGGVQITIETISPEMARQLLTRMTQRQRPLATTLVDKYAKDMLAGEWVLTGEPIQVGSDGLVMNGNHRLHAIIRANIPVNIAVAYNVDTRAFRYIDSGKTRTVADRLAIGGLKSATSVAAIAACLYQLKLKESAAVASFSETEQVLTEFGRWLEIGSSYPNHIEPGIPSGASGVRAGFVYASRYLAPCDFSELVSQVVTGVAQKGTPANALRGAITNQSRIGKGRYVLACKTIRACEAWKNGEKTVILRQEATSVLERVGPRNETFVIRRAPKH